MILTPSVLKLGSSKEAHVAKNEWASHGVYSQDPQPWRVSPETGNGSPESIEGEIQRLKLKQTCNVQSQISLQ